MAYTVTHTNGTTYTTLGDGVLNADLGIALIGQNYHNYGQLIANNFIRLLENQANSAPPPNPIAGQIWWNTATKVLSFFDGDRFKPCSSSAVGINPPLKPLYGDQWWDENVNQLKIYDGATWMVIGPTYVKGQAFSGLMPTVVVDTSSVNHILSTLQSNGSVVATVSGDVTYQLSVPINGITYVGQGITLAPNAMITGTALNSLYLGSIPAASYVTNTAAVNTLAGSLNVQGINGIYVGTANGLSIQSDSSSNKFITSTVGNLTLASGNAVVTLDSATGTVTLNNEPTVAAGITTKGYVDTLVTTTNTAMKVYVDSQINSTVGTSPISTLSALSAAINNDPNYYVNVNAAMNFKANLLSPQFIGVPLAPTAAIAESSKQIATTEFVHNLFADTGITSLGVLTGLTINGPIVTTTNNTVDIGQASNRFRNVYATAISARYADLAENYVADNNYDTGTVVVFGGSKEVTVSSDYCDHRIAGVVSTNPAYLMNDRVSGLPIALTGKVPCKVSGPVKKGDILVHSAFAGVATVLTTTGDWCPGCVIGKSLENNDATGIRNVMIAVGRF